VPPGVASEIPDLLYVPLVPTGITDESEEETDDVKYCFLCNNEAHPGLEDRHFFDNLCAILDRNYTRVSPLALTRQAQRYYNKQLRPYIADESLRKPWRKRIIWEHIHVHRPNARTITMNAVRSIQSMMSILEDNVRPVSLSLSLSLSLSISYLCVCKTEHSHSGVGHRGHHGSRRHPEFQDVSPVAQDGSTAGTRRRCATRNGDRQGLQAQLRAEKL